MNTVENKIITRRKLEKLERVQVKRAWARIPWGKKTGIADRSGIAMSSIHNILKGRPAEIENIKKLRLVLGLPAEP